MDILNAVLAALSKLGLEYLILEMGGILILVFMFFGVRKMINLQKINLANLDKYYENVCKEIKNHHDTTIDKIQEYQKEIDPEHLYSKLNNFEDEMEKFHVGLRHHQHEEVRQLHDVHNKVVQIDARLESVKLCRDKE